MFAIFRLFHDSMRAYAFGGVQPIMHALSLVVQHLSTAVLLPASLRFHYSRPRSPSGTDTRVGQDSVYRNACAVQCGGCCMPTMLLLTQQKLERMMATLVDLTFGLTVSEGNGDYKIADSSICPQSADSMLDN